MLGKAKEESDIANEKEVIEISVTYAMGKNKNGNIEEQVLQSELDKMLGAGKTEAIDIGEKFEILFKDSNRYYIIDKNGNIQDAKEKIEDKSPGNIEKDKDGNILDGTQEKPYEIWCIEDLVALSIITNGGDTTLELGSNNFNGKYVVLNRTLDFNSISSYNDYTTKIYGDLNKDGIVDNIREELTKKDDKCIGFTPIGNGYSFSGSFDGRGYEIRNIYEYAITNCNLGFFGQCSNATIKNLKVNGKIDAAENVNNGVVGGIVGHLAGTAEISNCINDVSINGKGFGVAGIAGRSWAKLKILNCANIATINGSNGEGLAGIVGRPESETQIYNSYNCGDIISSGSGMAGGIVGYFCAGSQYKMDIINVYNSGNIFKSGWGNGGIIGVNGSNGEISIKNAYNIGKVEYNNNYSGAILGYFKYEPSKIDIQNSYYLSESSSVAVGRKEDSEYGVTKLDTIDNDEIKNDFNEYIENNPDEMDLSNWKKWIVDNGRIKIIM